jgi:hypothetical protein
MAHPWDFGAFLKSHSYSLLEMEDLKRFGASRIASCEPASVFAPPQHFAGPHGRTEKTWLRPVKLHPEDQKFPLAEASVHLSASRNDNKGSLASAVKRALRGRVLRPSEDRHACTALNPRFGAERLVYRNGICAIQ